MSTFKKSLIERIPFIIGTAGHIDHGKTALVRALTGMDTDRLADEKRRGVSIDLGFAYLDIPPESAEGATIRAAIIDVPGHERFIRNMLAGTTGIDMVLFVVAADDGVMPQTREHLDIVHLLGISRGVFVITKKDLVGADRLEEVREEVVRLVNGSSLEGSPIVAVSALTGDGIPELRGLIKKFLTGRSRDFARGFFRLPVDRSFSVKGFGAVVTGTVASGSVATGEELLIFPTGAKVKVRGIQSLYMDADSVSSGERAAVNLSGISHREMERGFMVVDTGLKGFCDFASSGRVLRVDAVMDFFPGAGKGLAVGEGTPPVEGVARVIKNHATLKLHHFTGETLARVVFPGRRSAGPGEEVPGRLVLKKPLLMLRGDRFILRNPSDNTTVGGGRVTVTHLVRRYTPPVDTLGTITPSVSDETEIDSGLLSVLSGLLAHGVAGMDIKTASLMLNMSPEGLVELVDVGKATGFEVIGPYIASKEKTRDIKKIVKETTAGFHKSNPSEAGMEEDRLLREIHGVAREDAHLVRELISVLVDVGELKRTGSLVALKDHRPALLGKDAAVERDLMRLFGRGLPPPTADEVASLPHDMKDVERVLAYLVKNEAVVKLKEGSYISAEAANGAREKLVSYIKAKGGIKAAEFRDVLGCGRKLAIEILEYFDKTGVTLRKGDVRSLREA